MANKAYSLNNTNKFIRSIWENSLDQTSTSSQLSWSKSSKLDPYYWDYYGPSIWNRSPNIGSQAYEMQKFGAGGELTRPWKLPPINEKDFLSSVNSSKSKKGEVILQLMDETSILKENWMKSKPF